MARQSRPLWQILASISRSDTPVALTCQESFTVMEYVAETVMNGGNVKVLLQTIQHHLSLCPDCRERHLRRVKEWQATLNRQPGMATLA